MSGASESPKNRQQDKELAARQRVSSKTKS